MEHLDVAQIPGFDPEKLLSNWSVSSGIIYSNDITEDQMKLLLIHEATHKGRGMMIDRLKTRLLSLMKARIKMEIEEDLYELANPKMSKEETSGIT